MLTLALEPSAVRFPVQLLPLLTGLGVSRFIAESWGLETFVKWPNDLLLRGRKLSGILCESSRGCLLVGIGINITQTLFPDELMRRMFPPTSILLERSGGDRMDFKPGREAEYCRLVGGLLRALYDTYAADDWELQLTRRLWGIGQPVVFHTGAADSLGAGNHVSGILRGLSPDGGLRIDDRVFYAGEIRSFGSGGFQV
jgi:BirA family transcriptional regulator, biotin operon repressor / biotin---[acetyl-CoA-carboxylase] ligase